MIIPIAVLAPKFDIPENISVSLRDIPLQVPEGIKVKRSEFKIRLISRDVIVGTTVLTPLNEKVIRSIEEQIKNALV